MTTILITGASAGLGAEMARQFAARGHDLALCARRLDRLVELREEITSAHPGVDVQIAALDVTRADDVGEVFGQFTDHFGTIDRIIANAGIGEGTPLGSGAPEVNRRTVTTNVLGLLTQVEAALEIFRRQRRGHLVVLSSFAAVRGMRGGMTAYSASKAFVATLAEGVRTENIPGLSVTTLKPGYIRSEMNTRHLPFIVDTRTGVAAMVRAIEARRASAYIPRWPWALLAPLFRVLPAAVIRRLT